MVFKAAIRLCVQTGRRASFVHGRRPIGEAMGGTACNTEVPGTLVLAFFVAATAFAGVVPDAGASAPPDRPQSGSELSTGGMHLESSRQHGRKRRRSDRDRDGLPNRVEVRRTHTNPRRRDTDRDGLGDGFEVRRSKTNPRRRDTDRDGLRDRFELRRSKTNPRRADTDGDGIRDRAELRAGSDPVNRLSVPPAPLAAPPVPPPSPDRPSPEAPGTPPPIAKAVWTAPSGAQVEVPVTLDGTGSTGESCTWSFEDQSGSVVFQTRSGCQIDFVFEETGTKHVRLTVEDAEGNTDSNRQSFDVRPTETEPPEEPETEPPPPDTTPPNTTIGSGPPASTSATSASLSFGSSESGSSFECSLDGTPYTACVSPKDYSGLSLGEHTFSVRATDSAGNTDPTPATRSWTVEEGAPPPPPPPSGCTDGATAATSASQVRSAVQDDEDVCVTASLGNVNLSGLGSRPVVVSTDGGSMDEIDLASTTNLTIGGARFRSIVMRGSHGTKLLENTIGGTQANRVYDQLIFMPDTNNDVAIERNDIGWTLADDSGNTGYGCRCYGTLNRLRFVGNRLHDLAGDGFQGVGGSDVLIDRNEIGPVGRNPGSNEHSDNIQITGNGSNLRITNNWIHHQGYYEGGATANAGSTYIHGGDTSSLIYENNLIETAQGRTEICGLGTGGTSRSNIAIRRNTWVDGGRAFNSFPGFEWDCDSGSGNVVERNVAVDPDGGFDNGGSLSAATFSSNLWGQPSLVTLDGNGNCTSANCNPAGLEPIGYRKPSNVSW